MAQRRHTGWVALLVVCGTAMGQTALAPAPVIPMAADRADDSYRIYSQLMPGSEFEDRQPQPSLWLIERTTVDVRRMIQTPKEAIQALDHGNAVPENRRADMQELFADFERHTNERILLTEGKWNLAVKHRLLNDQETKEYMANPLHLMVEGEKPTTDWSKYEGAPGLTSFSQVFFNAHHTVAMVYTEQGCGGNCGMGYWVVLELKDGQWKQLPWMSAGWIS